MSQLEHIEAIERRLWSAADTLRANSSHASNEYFLPVMGLVFLRHAYSRYLAVKDDIEANLPTRGGVKRALTKEDFSQQSAIFLRLRGLEKNSTTIHLAKMNLAVHGLEGDIQQAITYYEDPHELVAWILTKINVEYIIKHVRREERPELPEEVLREAVANAVAHRDYRSTANVQIYVFKDRIEIVSPGGLPAGMEEARTDERRGFSAFGL